MAAPALIGGITLSSSISVLPIRAVASPVPSNSAWRDRRAILRAGLPEPVGSDLGEIAEALPAPRQAALGADREAEGAPGETDADRQEQRGPARALRDRARRGLPRPYAWRVVLAASQAFVEIVDAGEKGVALYTVERALRQRRGDFLGRRAPRRSPLRQSSIARSKGRHQQNQTKSRDCHGMSRGSLRAWTNPVNAFAESGGCASSASRPIWSPMGRGNRRDRPADPRRHTGEGRAPRAFAPRHRRPRPRPSQASH